MLIWRNDPEIARMVVSPMRFVGLETEQEWNMKARHEHEAGKTFRMAIRMKEDDRIVGQVFFSHVDQWQQSCRSGIIIGDRSVRGKGYSKKAYALALPYAFNELNLYSVRAYVLAYNAASQGMFRSLGFTHEGTQRAAVFKGGEFVDLEMFSLLRPEWAARQASTAGR